MHIRNIIRENREKGLITKDYINSKPTIIGELESGETYRILNTIENVANFIMYKNKKNVDSDMALYIEMPEGETEAFLNTSNFFIDLCANREYLQDLLEILSPMQILFQNVVFEDKELPIYTFILINDANEQESISI